MSDFQTSWSDVSLAEACLHITDGSHNPPKAAPIGFPMLSARNIQERQIIFENFRWITEADFVVEDARTRISDGDVLLTIVGTIGRTAVVHEGLPKFCVQRSVAVLKANDAIVPKYLAYALESPATQSYLENNAKGTAQKGIYLRALGKVSIPLAPLNEQKRIADKLDAVLARVDACRQRLDRVPAILKRFRQSVLAAAVNGTLTESWRNERTKPTHSWKQLVETQAIQLPKNYRRLTKQRLSIVPIEHDAADLPSTWGLTTIGDLYNKNILLDFADGNHGSLYPRKDDFGSTGAIFLTASQIGDNWELELTECPRLNNEKASQLTKGWALAGDVILTHNATVGRVAYLDLATEPVLLGTSATFYRFNSSFVDPLFGRIIFSSPFFQNQLESVMQQTTRNQVPITKQASLNFICPPIDEQREIVRRVNSLLDLSNHIKVQSSNSSRLVELLTPSLLAKAFRGELVPQDPDDEPARELLVRIQDSRSSKPEKAKDSKKTKRTPRKKVEVSVLTRKEVSDDHLTTILKTQGALTSESLWRESQLDIDDFYDQLKAEEEAGLLRERRGKKGNDVRLLEAA